MSATYGHNMLDLALQTRDERIRFAEQWRLGRNARAARVALIAAERRSGAFLHPHWLSRPAHGSTPVSSAR